MAGTAAAPPPSGRVTIDQRLIDRYAEASGDRNPLHVDPSFAAATPFGRTIAHGHLLIGVLSPHLERLWGERWHTHGSLEVKFVAPVFAGDTVEIELAALDPEPATGGDGEERYAVTLRVGERTVVAGTAACGMAGGA